MPAETPAHSFAFAKQRRLLCAADYSPVFDKADFKVSNSSVLILAKRNSAGTPRLGLVISKKNVRLAVDRNRLKRLIREAFRHRVDLPPLDIVVLARRGLAEQTNQVLSKEFDRLWDKLGNKARQSQ